MVVNYYGYTQDNKIRVAFVSITEKDSDSYVNEMIEQMDMKGWNIERDTQDSMICEVLDKEDYNDFMTDWKQCKKDLAPAKRRGMFK